jgi:hypothetical protein
MFASRFQSPVKKKKSQIATLVTDSTIPANKQCSNDQEGSTLFKSCIDLFLLKIFTSDEYFPYPIRHLNFQKIVEKCLQQSILLHLLIKTN